jgi:hypothetical protein
VVRVFRFGLVVWEGSRDLGYLVGKLVIVVVVVMCAYEILDYKSTELCECKQPCFGNCKVIDLVEYICTVEL